MTDSTFSRVYRGSAISVRKAGKSTGATLILLTALPVLAICIRIDAATIAVNDASSLRFALATAMDGDEIVLAPGVYHGRFEASGLTGVTIRSANLANRAIIDAEDAGEGFKLSSIERVTLRDLVVRNASLNALNIDDGGQVSPSHNVTLTNLLVQNGDGQAIKLVGVYGFHVDRVQVINWFGDNNGVELIGSHNGIIERSYFDNSSAPRFGKGVQAKGGSSDIIIRANRFVNANERAIQIGGVTGLDQFRPLPPGDVEASNVVAEGNVIVGNGKLDLPSIRASASFVNTKDSLYRNNLMIRPSGYVLRILKENRNEGFVDTQNGEFRDNIIIWETGDLWDAVNVGSSTDAETFSFEGNQWYNRKDPSRSKLALPSEEVGGVYGVNPGVSASSLVPWSFDWGTWVVNTTSLDLPYTVSSADALQLATPGDGAKLDLDQAYPLIGNWSLSPLSGSSITVPAMSYTLLMRGQPGDYNANQILDVDDLELLTDAVQLGTFVSRFDLDDSGALDSEDRRVWVEELAHTSFGDANLDGEFNSTDIVAVFQAGEYEDGVAGNSFWGSGDWDGDSEFGTSDFVLAFQSGMYEQGPRGATAAVPEPSATGLLGVGVALLSVLRRHRFTAP